MTAELANAKWPDIEAGPRRLLVVPLGSYEQHGPHLPLDTDTRIATALVDAVASLPYAIVAPAVPSGGSGAAEGDRVFAGGASVQGADAHAGRTETSLMLAIAPEAVRVGALEPGS